MSNEVMSNDGSPGILKVPPERSVMAEIEPGELGLGVSSGAFRRDCAGIGVRIRPG